MERLVTGASVRMFRPCHGLVPSTASIGPGIQGIISRGSHRAGLQRYTDDTDSVLDETARQRGEDGMISVVLSHFHIRLRSFWSYIVLNDSRRLHK
jgi:hypothetical protein